MIGITAEFPLKPGERKNRHILQASPEGKELSTKNYIQQNCSSRMKEE